MPIGARLSQTMFVVLCLALTSRAHAQQTTDWPNYGNDPGGSRYSPLAQINRDNVSKLKVAWAFHTGDISDGSHNRKRTQFTEESLSDAARRFHSTLIQNEA